MKALHYLIATCCVAFSLISCKSEPTLQTYFVDHQETQNFTTVDLPVSMLGLDETKLNDEQQQAIKSIKHLNFLGYKKDDTQTESYNEELSKVKDILNNTSYNDLMDVNSHGGKITLKYLGDDENAIDELIVFGSSNELGFGVLRVLGDDMKPQQIIQLAKALEDGDFDESQVKNVFNFFKKDAVE
ncbi:DUF4252 domain-containing protein [Formosa sp. A9]|uniref:DUF4252 domain-containing protein n=1 Tax=Formosa sp. A9 TaxID=3442641 RepID=UPI003EBC0AF6